MTDALQKLAKRAGLTMGPHGTAILKDGADYLVQFPNEEKPVRMTPGPNGLEVMIEDHINGYPGAKALRQQRKEERKRSMEKPAEKRFDKLDETEIPTALEDLAEPGEDWKALRDRLIDELKNLRNLAMLGNINDRPGALDRLNLLEKKNQAHSWMGE